MLRNNVLARMLKVRGIGISKQWRARLPPVPQGTDDNYSPYAKLVPENAASFSAQTVAAGGYYDSAPHSQFAQYAPQHLSPSQPSYPLNGALPAAAPGWGHMPSYSTQPGLYSPVSVMDPVNFSASIASSAPRAPAQLPAQPPQPPPVHPVPSASAQRHDGSDNKVRINGMWYAPIVDSSVPKG